MKTKLIIMMLFFSGSLLAQPEGKFAEVRIKTSSQCDMCKERIEETLAFEKGVKKAELDLETKIVTVTYKKSRTSADKLRKAIAGAGYDADDVPADKEAYEDLPACCKKPDDPDHKGHDHQK